MKRVFTGLVLALVLTLTFLLRIKSIFLFDICIGVLSIFASYEMAKILKKGGKKNEVWLSILFPTFAYVLLVFSINEWHWDLGKVFVSQVLLLLAVFVLLFAYYLTTISRVKVSKEEDAYAGNIYKYMFKCTMDSIFSFIYPTFLIMCMIILNHLQSFNELLTKVNYFDGAILDIGIIAIIFMLISTCATDIFALYVGTLIGGKKLAPAISPKKTISGAVGGLIGSVVSCVILYLVLINLNNLGTVLIKSNITILFVLIYAIVASIISQIGDLVESYLKRKANVKDSGNVLPGHGGIMDRIDGLSFNALITLLLFTIILI